MVIEKFFECILAALENFNERVAISLCFNTSNANSTAKIQKIFDISKFFDTKSVFFFLYAKCFEIFVIVVFSTVNRPFKNCNVFFLHVLRKSAIFATIFQKLLPS